VTYRLIDLSNHNAVQDFKAIRASGVEGVFLKITEGATFPDVRYGPWSVAARAAGLRVGAYHYAYPTGNDAVAEAQWFARVLKIHGGIGARDLRPVLDFEVNPSRMGGSALVEWARDWNQEVFRLTGTLPLFYSYPYFIQSLHADVPIGAGLWLASYGPNDGEEHAISIPAPWKKAVAHQFTSKGHVPGVVGNVDISSAAKLRPLLAHPVKSVVATVISWLGGGSRFLSM
jgi:lysozyme